MNTGSADAEPPSAGGQSAVPLVPELVPFPATPGVPLLRRAVEVDLPTVLAVLDDAAGWLHRRGIQQWPASFSDLSGWRAERIAAYIAAGDIWLASDERGALATITVTQKADADFAGGWPDGTDGALYVYRMAVRRAAAGEGLGARLLDWAGGRAARQGERWLRLDVHRRNHRLQRYYEQLGFERAATVRTFAADGLERGSGALYQRPARLASRPPVIELPS